MGLLVRAASSDSCGDKQAGHGSTRTLMRTRECWQMETACLPSSGAVPARSTDETSCRDRAGCVERGVRSGEIEPDRFVPPHLLLLHRLTHSRLGLSFLPSPRNRPPRGVHHLPSGPLWPPPMLHLRMRHHPPRMGTSHRCARRCVRTDAIDHCSGQGGKGLETR